MPMHIYPSWVVHIPKMGSVASTWLTQRVPQKLFTDGRTDRQTDGQSGSSMPPSSSMGGGGHNNRSNQISCPLPLPF